jgi:hypothetical protein
VVKPNVNDASAWKQSNSSLLGARPSSEPFLSAEDCIVATKDVFKHAVDKLLTNGFLDVQLGFTTPTSAMNQTPIMNEVSLQSPSGFVLGFVWHLKGSISEEWQKRYWERLDCLPFARYQGTGERVICIASEQLDNVFLLGRSNNRVIEAVPISDLENEFLQMVGLVMEEQKKIIKAYATLNELQENPNVFWNGDMVQTTIG